jgi:hypothetical protein
MTKKINQKKYAHVEEHELTESEELEEDFGEDLDEDFDDEASEFDDEDMEDEPVSDIHEDGDFDEEEDIGQGMDDQNAFEEENIQEEDQNENPEQTPAKVILVDGKKLELLAQNVSKGNVGSIRTITKIFNSVFGEKKTIATAAVYNIPRTDVLNRLLNVFLVDCAAQIAKLPDSQKNKIVVMTYLKGIYEYLKKLENESVAVFLLTHLKTIYPLYSKFKTLNKKIIKEIIDLWGKSQLFSTKFHCYILMKTIITTNENETRRLAFYKMLSAYLKYASNITWRTYTNFVFMRNCVTDSVALSMEIAYVVLFDKLKEMVAKVVDISKNKVS